MLKMDSRLREYIQLGGFVGLAQINPIAGNLEYNSKKIIDYIKQAEDLNLDIVAFPQNALIGFEMQDFFGRYPFILNESDVQAKKQLGNSIAVPVVEEIVKKMMMYYNNQ